MARQPRFVPLASQAMREQTAVLGDFLTPVAEFKPPPAT